MSFLATFINYVFFVDIELTEEGAQAIADIIKTNTTIAELSLSTELKDALKAVPHIF